MESSIIGPPNFTDLRCNINLTKVPPNWWLIQSTESRYKNNLVMHPSGGLRR